jgi:lipoprotein-anchoring transpeptidase ErfK/SrfK
MNRKISYALVIIVLTVLSVSLYNSFGSDDMIYQAPELTPTVVEALVPVTTVVQYVEIVDACNPYFVGECVNVREGPGTEFPVVARLRKGVVLKVGNIVSSKGKQWYTIVFTHELLYPERVQGNWYVSKEFVRPITTKGDAELQKGQIASTTKRIVVDVSEQKLYAYEGSRLYMEESISTGLEFTPTPRGTFTIFKMTPSRFMQGPIPGVSSQVYDLPGVPWNLYFTQEGAVIHGAYWHNHFGTPWSHGCVNLSPENAKKLYDWAEIGMKVKVQN